MVGASLVSEDRDMGFSGDWHKCNGRVGQVGLGRGTGRGLHSLTTKDSRAVHSGSSAATEFTQGGIQNWPPKIVPRFRPTGQCCAFVPALTPGLHASVPSDVT